ncbi:MAG: PAS domain S-box protein [Syntrophus sp. (in: bacteria)]
MTDPSRTIKELIEEISVLKQRIQELEQSDSERKRAEKAMRESEEKYRLIFENSPLGHLFFDEKAVIVTCNNNFVQIIGSSREALIGLEILKLTDKNMVSAIQKALNGSTGLYEGVYHSLSAKKITPMRALYAPMISEDGRILGGVGIFEDVSDRKQAEEALWETRRQLADIIEFLPDATLAIDKEGRVIIWNKAIEEMTGVPAAEIIGKGDYAYTIPFYGEARPQLMDLVFEDREEIANRYPQITREGDTLMVEVFCNALYNNEGAWVIAKASPLHDKSGNIIGAIESIRDITPRKRAEEDHARLNTQLHAKNKELGQLVYIASHDLRSPLVNIDGYSREVEYAVEELNLALDANHASNEALKAAVRLPVQEMSAALRYIRSSTTQMDALLTGLLKLSRSGRTALTIAPLNMKELISGVVAAIDFQVKEAGVELYVAELPPCLGDAVQVSQVFTNLLSNALNYLDPDRPGVIRICGVIEGERSVYSVEDNGIGIAPAHQENIFEVFHRLEPSKSEGDGLGLTIVRQIIGRLAGEVRVESKPGEGSRFSVTLPVAHD